MDGIVSQTNSAGLDRVIIEGDEGGFFAFGFARPAPSIPDWDYWFDTRHNAQQFCLEHWGVPSDTWSETSERHT
jgi:hypothetical protein